MRPHRWIAPAAVLALVAGTLSAGPPAAGSPPAGAPPAAASPQPRPAEYRITLVTGDKVRVTRQPGRPDLVVFQPTKNSRSTTAVVTRWGDHTLVVPSAAAADVRTGRLDRSLFDVGTLIAERYDDARAANLPVIVEYAGSKATANTRARTGITGALKSRPLTSLGARAAMLRRSTTFYANLPTAVRRVTLDRRVRAALDRSVPQIGVPAAWQRGLTGKGVKIAVLDTGVDASHPDLAGRVTSQDFSGSPDAGDHYGHGTHVASIAAGNGTASGGKYKGVAPEASVLNAKVLDDFGFGFESGIIAGMEWAAAQGAAVANLSLGTDQPSDGTDPVSQALNELSRTTRTLYVVAAGNNGPQQQTVGAPGAADAALTVGSNDRDGAISAFSSRGPRLNGGLKPEITAPGAEIVAARAQGTSMGEPVDDSYTTASGTSMATPHVTGVAALLAQSRPAWTPEQLKNRLIGTADPQTGSTVFEQGAGRVDADQASDGGVSVEPAAIDPGLLRWPFPSDDAVSRTITYTNLTQQPVTLRLAVQMQPGAPVPTLSTAQVTVPAGGQTTATVTVDRGSAGPGSFAGRITATPATGDPLVTIISWTAEPESYDLTVKGIDADGSRPSALLSIGRPDGGPMPDLGPFGLPLEDGTAKIRLPAGVYHVTSLFGLWATDTRRDRFSVVTTPQLRLDHDTVTTLDARKAEQIRVTVDGREDAHRRSVDVAYTRTDTDGHFVGGVGLVGATERDDVFATPAAKPSLGDQELAFGSRLEEWPYRARIRGGPAISVDDYVFGPRFTGVKSLPLVDAGTATPTELAGVRGRLALIRRTDDTGPADQAYAAQRAGAAGVLLYNPEVAGDGVAGFITNEPVAPPVTIPAMRVSRTTAAGLLARLASGPVTIVVTGIAETGYTYDVAVQWNRIPDRPVRRLQQRDFATIDESFGAHVPDAQTSEARIGITRLANVGGWMLPAFTAPYRRTSYVQTGPVQWFTTLNLDNGVGGISLKTTDQVLRSPTRTSRRFVVPVANSSQPGSGPLSTATGRAEGGLRINPCPFSYGPDVFDSCANSPGEYAISVSRDGEVIGSDAAPGLFLDVPAKAGAYRVELDAKRDFATWRYSTRIRSVWDFHSDGSQDEVMPLLFADLGVPQANLLNQVRTGKPTTITVGLRHQTGAKASPIAEPGVEISYDGTTWAPLMVRRTGTDKYAATVTHPASQAGKAPSLRITATDAADGKLVQRIDKAYGLIR